MKRQTGFTLVELVIVIAVLGILAGLAIPYFMEAREEAAKKECLANRTQIMRMFYAQQASNYNGTLVGFLAEVVKEPNILILSLNVPIMALTASVMKK